MVNEALVLELMKLSSANPKTFPRVLSAYVRQNILKQIGVMQEAMDLIVGETQIATRGRYLEEHLNDSVNSINELIDFLAYFRDVPLANRKIRMGEDIRQELLGYIEILEAAKKRVHRSDWKTMSEEYFQDLKEEARHNANRVYKSLKYLDGELKLDWISPLNYVVPF